MAFRFARLAEDTPYDNSADMVRTLAGGTTPSQPAAPEPAKAPVELPKEAGQTTAGVVRIAQDPKLTLMERQSALIAEQRGLIDKARQEKELSNDEKIALSLLSVLPTLVGTALGAAVAGGTGALAGAAGGLKGSATATESILAGGEKREQKLLDRADAKGKEITGLTETIGKLAEQEATQNRVDRRLAESIQAAKDAAAANRVWKTAMAEDDQAFRAELARLNNAAKLQAAAITAGDPSKESATIKTGRATITSGILNGMRNLDLIEASILKYGMLKKPWAYFDKEEGRARTTMASSVQQLVVMLAKLRDPTTGMRANEEELTRMGAFAAFDSLLEQIKGEFNPSSMMDALSQIRAEMGASSLAMGTAKNFDAPELTDLVKKYLKDKTAFSESLKKVPENKWDLLAESREDILQRYMDIGENLTSKTKEETHIENAQRNLRVATEVQKNPLGSKPPAKGPTPKKPVESTTSSANIIGQVDEEN